MDTRLYPFTARMARFAEHARDSYVGPRIYPLAAFLYAALNAKTHTRDGGREVDMASFIRIRDIITEFINDSYYLKAVNDPDLELEVPQRIIQRGFSEIVAGAAMMEDLAHDWIDDLPGNMHRFRVVLDGLRDGVWVMRR